MSIIGKKVQVTVPLSADKSEVREGVVLDKFRNSYVHRTEEKDPGHVVFYDNYLMLWDDGKIEAIHPTLITREAEETAVKKLPSEES